MHHFPISLMAPKIFKDETKQEVVGSAKGREEVKDLSTYPVILNVRIW